MPSSGDGTGWSETTPTDSGQVSDTALEIRDLRKGVNLRQKKEHVEAAAGSIGGEHLQGSAKAYFQDTFPTLRPDGDTQLDSDDAGRLLVTPTSGGLFYFDEGSLAFKPVVIDAATGIKDGSITGVKLAAGAVSDASPYAVIQDVKAANTTGGSFTQDVWSTRLLNTEICDTAGIVTLLGGGTSFRVAAGRYRIECQAPANQVNGHKIRLYNVTRSTVIAYGTSEFAGLTSGCNTYSRLWIEVYFGETTELRIEHRCQTTKTSNGLGAPSSTGANEVYSTAIIWKV